MATERMPRMRGAFHGAIPTTTPAGWRIAIAIVSCRSEGNHFTDQSVGLRGSLTQQSRAEHAIEHSPAEDSTRFLGQRARDFGLAAVQNIRGLQKQAAAAEPTGGVVLQAGKAAAAASTARRASSRPADAKREIISPVNGFVFSKKRGIRTRHCHFPSMNN